MEIRKPAYYDKFRCLAGKCPDSCCKDWDVQVDKQTAAFYRQLPGALGQQLRRAMYQEDGQIYFALRPDGRCPMWRDDGLCSIQVQQGESRLCAVCREFPRLRHDYGDFVELGLELSCPEAARWILSSSEEFWVTEQTAGGSVEYDRDAMAVLLQSRQEALSILADKHRCIPEALALLLTHGCLYQRKLDGETEEIFNPDTALRAARQMAQSSDGRDLRDFFLGLEILTPQWRARLEAPPASPVWREECRAAARYFVQRYYLQAVSDYDLAGRVKFAVVSCLLISLLGGDFVQTAQLYSKEIENDADNVDALLEGAYTAPAMADAKLFGLLLDTQ